MGVIAEWGRGVIDMKEEDLLDGLEGRLAQACQEATKEIRDKITEDWFAGYGSPVSTNEAGLHTPTVSMSGKSLVCVTRTRTEDPPLFAPPSSTVEKWSERHNAGLDDSWILHLLYDEGIIGLPKQGTVPLYGSTYWENPAFKKKEPLYDAVSDTSKWNPDFEKKVKSKLGLS